MKIMYIHLMEKACSAWNPVGTAHYISVEKSQGMTTSYIDECAEIILEFILKIQPLLNAAISLLFDSCSVLKRLDS